VEFGLVTGRCQSVPSTVLLGVGRQPIEGEEQHTGLRLRGDAGVLKRFR
jgi:hypothetical protein